MSKRIRVIERKIDFGEYTLVLILFSNKNSVLRVLKDKYNVDIEEIDDAIGMAVIDSNYVFLCLDHSFSLSDLVHELFHLTYYMLSRYNITLKEDTHETYAMHIDSLFRIVVETFKKNKIKLPEL